MARTITGTNRADRIVQGGNINDTELTIFARGGADTIILNRTDDFGGRNQVDAGSGNDNVVNMKEDGSFMMLLTTNQAATPPANSAKIAVDSPSMAYS